MFVLFMSKWVPKRFYVLGGSPGDSMSLTSSAHFPPRLLSAAAGRGDHVRDEATLIAYQVFTSNKENVNMCLEILRQVDILSE